MAHAQTTAPMLGATRSPEEAAQSAPEQTAAARIPVATYRLQFNAGFTFRQAAALVPYLQNLGISDIYASPLLKARSGSTHGYDVCDPTQLNPALGSQEDFDAMVQALQERKMGLLLDTVPNHMGIGDVCNVWWMDVLENGPSSPYATFFDIDWHPIKPEFENKVLLPVLEDQYGAVLEGGKLRLSYEEGAFYICYYHLKLPVAPGTYRIILDAWLQRLLPQETQAGAQAGQEGDAAGRTGLVEPTISAVVEPGAAPGVLSDNEDVLELQSILTAVNHLPSRTETERQRVYERYREKEVIKRRIAAVYNAGGEAHAALDAALVEFNGKPGDPHSFDLLDSLMGVQVFRLAFWRVAGEEINYRRFFDVNDLAALRVEAPEVFQATHQLMLRLVAEGKATGLRIDHPDGLWDPATYFSRLQESYVRQVQGEGAPDTEAQAAPDAAAPSGEEPGKTNGVRPQSVSRATGSAAQQPVTHQGAVAPAAGQQAGRGHHSHLPLYVVAEKILSEREPLPLDWEVYGTTGYDFLAAANNIFVDAGNRAAFDRVYQEFTGQTQSLEDLTIGDKIMIMRESLSSEINALSHQLERIGERNRHYRDFTLNGMAAALREVIACLPVYRTYINALTGEVSERDRKFVQMAVRRARRRRPGLAGALFAFIEDTLLLNNIEHFRAEDQPELANFVMKFQQMTGPVMAKGVEDTAFYTYNRLVSLNEVGNSPDQFGISVADFHRDGARRRERWPHSMLATSTHDNKRSEDVRARIDVLSEMPEAWRTALARWGRLNNAKKTMVDGQLAPDRNDEYLLYQTLLGTWPLATSDSAGSEGEEIQPPQATEGGQMGEGTQTLAAAQGPSTGLFDQAPHAGESTAEDDVGAPAAESAAAWTFLLRPSQEPAFDAYRQRIVSYAQKAAKEAKVHTSWINGDAEYDKALESYVERVLDAQLNSHFLGELGLLARRVAYYGQFNSLAQVLLKLTSPGVPDIYQGQELWDFSLVDPDNRRPVDYERRQGVLNDLQERVKRAGDGKLLDVTEDLLEHARDGRIKLYTTAVALAFRQRHEALFAEGNYTPLATQGVKAGHVCAFARQRGEEQVLVVVPRLVVGLTNGIERPPLGDDVWGDAWLALPAEAAGAQYRNVYTNEILVVSERDAEPGLPLALILGHFPVALLERKTPNGTH